MFCGTWAIPSPGTEPMSPALQVDSLPLSHQGSPKMMYFEIISNLERKWQESTDPQAPPSPPLWCVPGGVLHVHTLATLPPSAAKPMPTAPEPTMQDPFKGKQCWPRAHPPQIPCRRALRATPLRLLWPGAAPCLSCLHILDRAWAPTVLREQTQEWCVPYLGHPRWPAPCECRQVVVQVSPFKLTISPR